MHTPIAISSTSSDVITFTCRQNAGLVLLSIINDVSSCVTGPQFTEIKRDVMSDSHSGTAGYESYLGRK